MINKMVIYLIRKRLHLKPYEKFRFSNQRTDDIYYFASDRLMKVAAFNNRTHYSDVSLNWLLDKKCGVVKYNG